MRIAILLAWFYLIGLLGVYAAPVSITTQMELDNYLATLTDNTIPASDTVTISGVGIDIIVDIVNEGIINISNTIELKPGVLFTNNGTLNIASGTFEMEGSSTLINNRILLIDDSTFDMEDAGNIFNNYGTITTDNNISGSIYGTFNNFGTLTMNHPSDDLEILATGILNNCGSISGNPTAEIQNDNIINTNEPITSIIISNNPPIINASICPRPAPVPTIEQWGIIILSLLMLIFGAIALNQRKVTRLGSCKS